jgi:hypothetical protein
MFSPLEMTSTHASDIMKRQPQYTSVELISESYLDRLCCTNNHHGYFMSESEITIFCGQSETNFCRICLQTGAMLYTRNGKDLPQVTLPSADLESLQEYKHRWARYPYVMVERCGAETCSGQCATGHTTDEDIIIQTEVVETFSGVFFTPGRPLYLIDPGSHGLEPINVGGIKTWYIT